MAGLGLAEKTAGGKKHYYFLKQKRRLRDRVPAIVVSFHGVKKCGVLEPAGCRSPCVQCGRCGDTQPQPGFFFYFYFLRTNNRESPGRFLAAVDDVMTFNIS